VDRAILKTFGQRLRVLRGQAGLSQEALADRCGLHRTYVGSVERGERNPSILIVFRIAEGLGVPANRLLGDVDCTQHAASGKSDGR
jgi:transcriptional regulator with XRE-family HTH domain